MISVYEELRETSRRNVLAELRSGAKSVNDLVRATGLKQPNVSNHLARLRCKGLVRHVKIGRQVYYSLSSPEIEAAVTAVLAIRPGCCEEVELCPLAERFALAACQGDEVAAAEIMDEAFRANASLVEIYRIFLGPAMCRVGKLYEAGKIDEADEHLATEITLRMMARTAQLAGPARCCGKAAVIGGPPNGWHTIGMRMAADLLKLAGWRAFYLGPNVPVAGFVRAVQTHRPYLALVGCGSEESKAGALEIVRDLHQLRGEETPYLIGIGGWAAGRDPKAFMRAGADFGTSSLRRFACTILPEIERTGFVNPKDAW